MFNFFKTVAEEWLAAGPFNLAAALAYYTLFSLTPLFIILTGAEVTRVYATLYGRALKPTDLAAPTKEGPKKRARNREKGSAGHERL